MRFRILGPLEVWNDGEQVPAGGRKQRALLVALLLEANRVVPADRLIAMIWGDDPPATAVAQLQTRVSILRRTLVERDAVLRRGGGYLIRIAPGELDLHAFEDAARAGSAALAAGHPAHAGELLRRALDHWRGPALADVTESLADAERDRLEERRMAALEERIEADLALGRHAELIGELTGLVATHPLRERLRGLLMLALYRSGRQADALTTYRAGRGALVEQLGLEPGAELQKLERAILANDPTLDPATGAGATGDPTDPAELPPDVPDFTGRDRYLEQIQKLLDGDVRRAVPIVVISGPGGVGKTALAVHAGHRFADWYGDGQLHVDLQGVEEEPADPAMVLARFLRALGAADSAIPDHLDERAALYRSRLADRRMLIVLDNAASERQVRPLLPGSPTCAVFVTSRSRLAGLAGAGQVALDVFSADEALTLLTRIVGAQRLGAHAGRELAQLCGHLPLAVRIAAARLAARPHWSVDRFTRLLSDERRRLDELRIADVAVRASLALSYRGLDTRARRLLRLLALLDAHDVAAWVAAALLDCPLAEAEQTLEHLVDSQLVRAAGRDRLGQLRYGLHDLVRLYGREQADREEIDGARRAAIARALGAWLVLARDADARLPLESVVPIHGAGGYAVELPAEAAVWVIAPADWLDIERANLTLAVEQARDVGLAEIAWDLAGCLLQFLNLRSYSAEWERTHVAALRASQSAGDTLGEAVALRGLGLLREFQRRHAESIEHHERAHAAYLAVGERRGAAEAMVNIGHSRRLRGDHAGALRAYTDGLQLAARTGARSCEPEALFGIAVIHRERGQFPEALAACARALLRCRDIGARRLEAHTLRLIGIVHREQDRLEHARRDLDAALAIFRDLGDRLSEAHTLETLGTLHLRKGDLEQARNPLTLALRCFNRLGSRHGEATALRALGRLAHAEGALYEAAEQLERCTEICREIQLDRIRAEALGSLSEVWADAGDERRAARLRAEAAAVYRRIGLPVPPLIPRPRSSRGSAARHPT